MIASFVLKRHTDQILDIDEGKIASFEVFTFVKNLLLQKCNFLSHFLSVFYVMGKFTKDPAKKVEDLTKNKKKISLFSFLPKKQPSTTCKY